LNATTSKDECTWTRLTSVVFTRKRPFTEEYLLNTSNIFQKELDVKEAIKTTLSVLFLESDTGVSLYRFLVVLDRHATVALYQTYYLLRIPHYTSTLRMFSDPDID
jgi:hypothetical protein